MIEVTCMSCLKTIQVPDEMSGQTGRCKSCRGRIQIPTMPSEMPPSIEIDAPDATAKALASVAAETPPKDPDAILPPHWTESLLRVMGYGTIVIGIILALFAATESSVRVSDGSRIIAAFGTFITSIVTATILLAAQQGLRYLRITAANAKDQLSRRG